MSAKELQEIISPKFTEQVLLDIVKKKSGLNDISVKKITIGGTGKKGDAYLSDICRFTIEATGKNSEGREEAVSFPVIVKFLLKNLGRRKTYRSTDFFENEYIFYKKVWTPFQQFLDSKQSKFDNIPVVLASWVDGSNDFIAMVDVSYEGYEAEDRGAGCSYEYTVSILRLLANFHAVSLAFKHEQPEAFEKAATSLKETYFAEKYRSWYERFQAKLFEIARDAVEKELPPMYLKRIDDFLSKDLYGLCCKCCEVRGPLSVVTHGDVWVPNFLAKKKSDGSTEKIIMIDFQLARYTTLVNDITFFLLICADFNVVEKQWDDLVGEYHKALEDSLVKLGCSKNLVTLEALQAEIKTHFCFGVVMTFEGLIMSLLDDDEISDLDAIQGDEAVPLESVWIVHPLTVKNKRQRVANMVKFAIDRNFI